MFEYLLGLGILIAFFLMGNLLHGLGLPIPGGVLGLLLLYLALQLKLLKMKWITRTADLMLRHMVLLFLPLTVGLMGIGEILSKHALAITCSLLVSLASVLLTTGLLGKWLLPDLREPDPAQLDSKDLSEKSR